MPYFRCCGVWQYRARRKGRCEKCKKKMKAVSAKVLKAISVLDSFPLVGV